MKFGENTAVDKRVIAQIAREHGPRLLQQAINRLSADPLVQDEILPANEPPAKPSLGKRIAGAALLRLATRSVPGAILVSGGLIAKALHDRRKARRSAGGLGRFRG